MSPKSLIVLFVAVPLIASAAEIQHFFSSPAFSGVGYSTHVLTIKQLEDQQRDKNTAKAEALKAKAEADALNTPQAQFTANLQSRIYAQLAKQITDSLFGVDGAPASCSANSNGNCGETQIGGNTITWRLTDPTRNITGGTEKEKSGMIYIDIAGTGGHTWMYVPSGTFGF